MKLSISNIGWSAEQDLKMYELMKKYGYSGLEIAPTRIFPKEPYDQTKKAQTWSEQLRQEYNLSISSMQSIWYGRKEKLFGTEWERKFLIEYTQKAIDFAAAMNCKNLVFGCPRNRVMLRDEDWSIGVSFFREIAEYALSKGTVIGMEANPSIYHTNFINDTRAALEIIKEVNSKGFLLNLDLGTMIQNEEQPEALRGNVKYINHVHISEPNLKPIEKRKLHETIRDILLIENYRGFVSVEMGQEAELRMLECKLSYIKEVFG